jgi:hypothetical protein
MTGARGPLWGIWAGLAGTLAIWPALPELIGHRADPWYAAQSAVAGFVLALLSLAAALGSFALREALVFRDVRERRLDPSTPAGRDALRLRLVALWLLCAVIGSLGGIMIWYSDRLALGLPYLAGSAVLFVVHAPWPWLLDRIRAGAGGAHPEP